MFSDPQIRSKAAVAHPTMGGRFRALVALLPHTSPMLHHPRLLAVRAVSQDALEFFCEQPSSHTRCLFR